jgi:hypothetical protein
MMPITADTHVQLNVSAPKKSATVGTGSLTLGANEVAIKVGSSVAVANITEIVAAFEKLFRFAKMDIKNVTADTVWSMPLGGSDNSIVKTGHAVGLVSLYADAAILAEDKSHFFQRTYRRCVERLLEESK